MTWLERLRTASFRGVPFYVEVEDTPFGREKIVHTYPYRDDATVQDLGKNPRHYSFDAYIAGPDYDQDVLRLMAAVEDDPTAGKLVHPLLGEKTVHALEGVRTRQRTAGEFETVRLHFIEVDKNRTATQTLAKDIQNSVANSATAVDLAVAQDTSLATVISGTNLVSTTATTLATTNIAALRQVVQTALATVSPQLSHWLDTAAILGNQAASLIANPLGFAAQVLNLNQSASPLFSSALNAYSAYKRLLTVLFKPDWGFVNQPQVSPTRQQININTASARTLWRFAALTNASKAAIAIDFTNRDQVIAIRAELANLLSTEVELLAQASIPAANSYGKALQLKAETIAALNELALPLPRFKTVILSQPQPALVLAHELYDQTLDNPTSTLANRADELIAENRATHPNALPANTPLKALTA